MNIFEVLQLCDPKNVDTIEFRNNFFRLSFFIDRRKILNKQIINNIKLVPIKLHNKQNLVKVNIHTSSHYA